mgnify:CR=1 FL=1
MVLSLQERSHRFKSCSAHKGFSEIHSDFYLCDTHMTHILCNNKFVKKYLTVLLFFIFISCSSNSDPGSTELYLDTWDNFKLLDDWQQEAISCTTVVERTKDEYPNPNIMEEFEQYFFDHKANAGIPEWKPIWEFSDEELERFAKSVEDNPEKFIKSTPSEVKENYKYRLLEHIRYIGSVPYGKCVRDASDSMYSKEYYIEDLEFLIFDVIEHTNVGFKELCMIGFYVEIAIENITYNNPDYDESIWCRNSW